jgi:hypothetical protein
MSLKHSFKQANKFIRSLDPDNKKKLQYLCKNIQKAEERLNRETRENPGGCRQGCPGLCCKNVKLDTIIDTRDFVFLLTVERGRKETMEKALEKEDIFFPCDCVFLLNGEGPCMFPDNSRPQVCITSFCLNESLYASIKTVKSEFARLGRFIHLQKIRAVKRIFNPKPRRSDKVR